MNGLDVYGLFFGSTNYWFFLGTVYLIILTWQDYKINPETGKRGMMVDGRLNYFMMGSTFSLLSHVRRPVWYVLVLVVMVVILGFLLKRFKLIGSADMKSIGWIWYGLAIINVAWLGAFCVVFMLVAGLYAFLKFVVFRRRESTPFYAVLLVCFLVVSLFVNGYGFW